MSEEREQILQNNQIVIISQKSQTAIFLSDEKALQRMLLHRQIKDGDLIIKLTEDTIRVAKRQTLIKLN